MDKFYRYLCVLASIALLISSCSSQAVQTQQAALKPSYYQDLLGKPLNDKLVVELVTTNHCILATQYELCKEIGMALWVNSNQLVETVYLYLNNVDGFAPYRGELPLGLKFYDTLGAVEYKLKRQNIGNDGRPDESGVPDRLHYWATYKQHGVTIIYNSPFADEDATIHAILVHQKAGS